MKNTVDFSKLISDAINGDNAAFEELYNLTSKSAYYIANLLLKNHEDVQDVLQNSYIKAFQKLAELKNPDKFESWIKTIVENECKNYIKKESRFLPTAIFSKNKTEKNSEEWNQPILQEYIEREELRNSVTKILDSLSPETRASIVLFHYEEKSINEISELLDIPAGTVKSRLYNGRKQIEKEFRKLQKKDTSLLGIGAVPFLVSLLLHQQKDITVPAAISEKVIAVTATAASASAVNAGAAAGTVTAVSSVAITGGTATTIVASTAFKITAIIVAGSVAVGGTAVAQKIISKRNTESTANSSSEYITEEFTTHNNQQSSLFETSSESTSANGLQSFFSSLFTQESSNSTEAITQTNSTSHSTRVSSTAISETTAKTTQTTTEKTTSTTQKPTTASTTTTTTTATTTTTKAPLTTTTTAAPTTSPENNYTASGGIITEYAGTDSNVSIPSSIASNTVTAIGSGAFAGNTSIKSVSLPSTVTQIGQEAFADCSSLSSVSMPSSLKSIGIGAFYNCTSLTSVTIPEGTQTISDEAFAQCSSLQTVTVPSSVTSISSDAFYGCNSITIRCEEGSAAHDFAITNGFDYILI